MSSNTYTIWQLAKLAGVELDDLYAAIRNKDIDATRAGAIVTVNDVKQVFRWIENQKEDRHGTHTPAT